MKHAVLTWREALMVCLGALVLALMAGCTGMSVAPVNADGAYCHRIGKSYDPSLTCTPGAVPSVKVEAEAKRFDADPGALTVYVVRRRWGDASMVVPVFVDGAASVATIPESVVRLRLAPKAHRLSARWSERVTEISVEGKAGEIRFVELVGSGWIWGTTFRWEPRNAESAKPRVLASKLVADVDLRR